MRCDTCGGEAVAVHFEHGAVCARHAPIKGPLEIGLTDQTLRQAVREYRDRVIDDLFFQTDATAYVLRAAQAWMFELIDR